MTPDDLYAALVEMHRGLDEQQSLLVSARLILLLARHIEDDSILRRAIEDARDGIADAPPVT